MMKECPFCGGKLAYGLLRSSRLIYWSEGESQGLYAPVDKYGDIRLPGASQWMGSDCPSFYCKNCELLLTSTKEEETP